MAERNTDDIIVATMTDEEVAALKEAADGFETEDGDFSAADLKTASESMRERMEREADGVSYDTGDDDGEGDEGGEGDDKIVVKDVDGDPEPKKAADADEAAAAAEKAKADADAAAAAEAEAAAATAEPEPKPEPKRPEVTQETYMEALDRANKAIEEERVKLADQLDDMAITKEEFAQKNADLTASLRDRVNHSIAELNFEDAVGRYLGENPTLNSEAHMPGLNLAFAAIDKSPLYDGLSDYEKIEKAHEVYASQVADAVSRGRNIPPVDPPKSKKAPPAPNPAAAAATPKQPQPATPAKPEPPITLAKMPASDPGAGDTKNEKIAKLLDSNDPDAIEDALLRGQISTEDLEAMG